MKIVLDNREHTLIKLMKALATDYGFTTTIEISSLPLGDVVIKNDADEDLIILERKKLSDLASSIRDGRYAEQSYRLNGHSLHNHNIIYLIEGRISQYNSRYTKVKPNTLYSTMFSLNYFKGFSVFRTFDISETAEFILRFTDKLERETMKYGYYHDKHIPKNIKYENIVHTVKKDNVTPKNISAILLSQIPNVSNKTAEVVLKKYSTFIGLIRALEKDRSCLNKLTYETKNGSIRKLSKTATTNISKYILCDGDNETIKIDT